MSDKEQEELAAWYDKGAMLQKQGQYEEAIQYFDKVLESNPQNYKAWFCKGLSLDTLGYQDKAIECYNKSLEIRPQFIEVWFMKAAIEFRLGQNQDGYHSFKKFISLSTSDNRYGNIKAELQGILNQLAMLEKNTLQDEAYSFVRDKVDTYKKIFSDGQLSGQDEANLFVLDRLDLCKKILSDGQLSLPIMTNLIAAVNNSVVHEAMVRLSAVEFILSLCEKVTFPLKGYLIEMLIQTLIDPDERVRLCASKILDWDVLSKNSYREQLLNTLISIANSDDMNQAHFSLRLILKAGDREQKELAAQRLLSGNDPSVRKEVIDILSACRDPYYLPLIAKGLDDIEETVVLRAVIGLGQVANSNYINLIQQAKNKLGEDLHFFVDNAILEIENRTQD